MRARRHGHRAEAQQPADALLHRRALLAERGVGAGAAAQHGDEQARRRLTQALDVAQQLVDPDRDLVAEGGGHGVLAVGAAGHRHVGAVRSARSAIADSTSPIWRRKMACAWRSTSRSPVWVMFCVVAPQWTQPPCGSPTMRPSSQTSGTIVWPVRAKPSSMRARSISSSRAFGGDRLGRLGGNDAEFGLRAGQRGLDVQPGLPAIFQTIQRADAGVGDAGGGG